MNFQHVADGRHLDFCWYVQRLSDQRLLITISGYVGPTLAYRQEEKDTASPADVKALIEEEIAVVRKRQERVRKPEAAGAS